MMRICIDIDGTICRQKNENEFYEDMPMLPLASEKINKLYDDGAYIILFTARMMGYALEDRDKADEMGRELTEKWLKDDNIKYHELLFGKPTADVYIDDKALKFDNWNNVYEKLTGEQNG